MAPIQEGTYAPARPTECPSSESSMRRRGGERMEPCPSSGSSIELDDHDAHFTNESEKAMREDSPACSVDYGGGSPSPSAAADPSPFTEDRVAWNEL